MAKFLAFSLLITLENAVGIVADARPAQVSESPKAVVPAFYKMALQGLKPAEACARFADSKFMEHSQDSLGGTAAATVEFLNKLIVKSPQRKWDVVRAIAEGELVFLHARFKAAPDAPEIVTTSSLVKV